MGNDKVERAELTQLSLAAMEMPETRLGRRCVCRFQFGRHIIKGGKDGVIHVKIMLLVSEKHANKGKGVSDSIIVGSIRNVLGETIHLSDQSWSRAGHSGDLEEAIDCRQSEVPLLALNASVSGRRPQPGSLNLVETGCDTSAYFADFPDDYYSDCDDEDQEPEDIIADPAEWVGNLRRGHDWVVCYLHISNMRKSIVMV